MNKHTSEIKRSLRLASCMCNRHRATLQRLQQLWEKLGRPAKWQFYLQQFQTNLENSERNLGIMQRLMVRLEAAAPPGNGLPARELPLEARRSLLKQQWAAFGQRYSDAVVREFAAFWLAEVPGTGLLRAEAVPRFVAAKRLAQWVRGGRPSAVPGESVRSSRRFAGSAPLSAGGQEAGSAASCEDNHKNIDDYDF